MGRGAPCLGCIPFLGPTERIPFGKNPLLKITVIIAVSRL